MMSSGLGFLLSYVHNRLVSPPRAGVTESATVP